MRQSISLVDRVGSKQLSKRLKLVMDMTWFLKTRIGWLLAVAIAAPGAAAQGALTPQQPMSLADAVRMATERRDEIQAARARARAGEARPAIVSALADPMISPALDHLPFMLGGADVSVTIEQVGTLTNRVVARG